MGHWTLIDIEYTTGSTWTAKNAPISDWILEKWVYYWEIRVNWTKITKIYHAYDDETNIWNTFDSGHRTRQCESMNTTGETWYRRTTSLHRKSCRDKDTKEHIAQVDEVDDNGCLLSVHLRLLHSSCLHHTSLRSQEEDEGRKNSIQQSGLCIERILRFDIKP